MTFKKKTKITSRWIEAKRGEKNNINPQRPYAWLVEKEHSFSGKVEDTAILFLTNRECSFKCLMCDLWKNTTDETVPLGAIPEQIEWALEKISPSVKHIKLYNSGSFFDKNAIPLEDYQKIADLLKNFETVIVESHTHYIGKNCLRFKELLQPELQIAIGLETVHPEILQKLNKKLTLEDFKNSVEFLTQNNILSRAFILLRPPFMTEDEGILWAKKSIDFAFETGVECCIVIPVRAGNGAMDVLMKKGDFSPPNIQSLETVLDYGIGLKSGRVFADTWDLKLFSNCEKCIDKRTARLTSMNLKQNIEEKINCSCTI